VKYLVFLLLTGCATEFRDPKTGVVVMRTQADVTNLTFTSPGYSFHADSINHSNPIRAAGSIIGTTGAAIAASGITAIVK
jgi:hypothetical protein